MLAVVDGGWLEAQGTKADPAPTRLYVACRPRPLAYGLFSTGDTDAVDAVPEAFFDRALVAPAS